MVVTKPTMTSQGLWHSNGWRKTLMSEGRLVLQPDRLRSTSGGFSSSSGGGSNRNGLRKWSCPPFPSSGHRETKRSFELYLDAEGTQKGFENTKSTGPKD